MDIRGIWKIKELRMPTPEGEKVFTPDNIPDKEEFDDIARMMQCTTEFAEDGVLNTLLFVPEEMREQAKAQGAVIRDDGYAVVGENMENLFHLVRIGFALHGQLFAHFVVSHAAHFYVYVYPVEERSGQFGQIFAYLRGSTGAFRR